MERFRTIENTLAQYERIVNTDINKSIKALPIMRRYIWNIVHNDAVREYFSELRRIPKGKRGAYLKRDIRRAEELKEKAYKSPVPMSEYTKETEPAWLVESCGSAYCYEYFRNEERARDFLADMLVRHPKEKFIIEQVGIEETYTLAQILK